MLALFQWVLPTAKRLSSILLIAFLLFNGIQLACVLVLWSDLIQTAFFFNSAAVPYLLVFAVLGKGPILFFYVQSLTRHKFGFRKYHLLHALPIVFCWLAIFIFNINSDNLRWRFTGTANTENIVTYLWHVIKAVPFLYGVASVYLVYCYYGTLKDQYSSISAREPRWLSVLTMGFLFSGVFSVVVHVSAQFTTPGFSSSLGVSENYLIFVLVIGLFMYSLVYAQSLLTTKPMVSRDSTLALPDSHAIDKVKVGMVDAKLYLEHNLNIEEFSKRIQLPMREVSTVINKHFNTNFFEFMNSYRVEEAKRLLSDHSLKGLTILDILLRAGFNSKSAFHRFFKRLVGVSPSAYRKSHTV